MFSKNILLCVLFIWLSYSFNNCLLQQNHSNYKSLTNNSIQRDHLDIWDIQLSVNLIDGTGAEFDGTYFYITNGFNNLIYKYDSSGNPVDTFSIPGVSNLNDIAFDGTYMYGGNGSHTIYQMDFSTQSLVGTITAPFNIRHVAYDENNDAFWIGSWNDPLALISRSGIVLNIFNIWLPFITGIAYDNVSSGGPYLWIFERGDSIPSPQLIHQFNILSGSFTGVTHDVLSDIGIGQPNAVAGGLFTTSDFVPGTFSLGGVLVGSPSILFVYELLKPTSVELMNDYTKNIESFSLMQNYPNPFNPLTKIKFTIPLVGFIMLKVFDALGNEIATLINEEKPAGKYEVEFDINRHSRDGGNLSSGIYFYQLRVTGPEINSGQEMIKTKKMVFLK